MRKMFLFLWILPYSLFANSIFNPPWCNNNYSWRYKKDISIVDNKLISKDILDKTEYSSKYAKISEKFYSKSYSDTIVEYINYNGEKKHIILGGVRVTELYDFLFTALHKNKQLLGYLTCSKQFDDLNEADYTITEVSMMLPPNGKGSITRYGTEYAKSHNLALLMSSYARAFSSIITSEKFDDITKALMQYMVENPFRASQIAFKIKNAKSTADIIIIVYDEIIRILNIIKESPKYKEYKYSAAVLEQFNKNYKDVIKNKNNNVYQSLQDILTTNIKDIINYIAKEGFNATIKWLGLEGVVKTEEALMNIIIASGMQREMQRETNKKPVEFFAYYFKDVPYKKNYDYLTTAVYYLLKNNIIPFPNKKNNYNFYPNRNIQKGDLAKMLINTFLYDEYMTYNSNAKAKETEIGYLYHKVMGISIGNEERIWDFVTPALMKLYLKTIFEYKTLEIVNKKYQKLPSNKQKMLKDMLKTLAEKSFGVAKINDNDTNSYLTRGEATKIIFTTIEYDLNAIVKKVYESIIIPKIIYKQYDYGEDKFFKINIPTSNPSLYIQKGGKLK